MEGRAEIQHQANAPAFTKLKRSFVSRQGEEKFIRDLKDNNYYIFITAFFLCILVYCK
jgi:hypothetical protein